MRTTLGRIESGGALFCRGSFCVGLLRGREEVEGDVGGLELLRFGVGDVVGQAAVGTGSRGWRWGAALRDGCGVASGQHAAGDRFGVAFDAAELAGDHDARVGLELQGFREQAGRVDVGVAVDLAVAQEGRVFEAGDEAEDARLLAELQVVLEADEVVAVGAEVLLTKLDARRRASGRSSGR